MPSLETINRRLQLYYDKETKLMEAMQSYTTPDGMSKTEVELRDVRLQIDRLEQQAAIYGDSGGYDAQPFAFGGR